MRKCPTCGTPFSENDNFCGKCGTTLKMQPPEYSFPSFPAKPANNFANGFQMGIAITVVIVGLLLVSSLNSIYWNQRNTLTLEGVNVRTINWLLLDTESSIAFSAAAVIFGVYFLAFAALTQFNPTMRALLSNGINRARLGYGLISGGIIAVSFFVMDYVNYAYEDVFISPATAELSPIQLAFGVGGIAIVFTGIALLTSSYFKSLNSVTKV